MASHIGPISQTEMMEFTPGSTRPPSPFSAISPAPRRNPFATPGGATPSDSRQPSIYGSSSGIASQKAPRERYFRSRRINKDEVEKPWLEKKDKAQKWQMIIPLIGLAVGFVLAGYLIYDGLSGVNQNTYCLIMDDDFSEGLDSSIWTKEVEVGGYG